MLRVPVGASEKLLRAAVITEDIGRTRIEFNSLAYHHIGGLYIEAIVANGCDGERSVGAEIVKQAAGVLLIGPRTQVQAFGGTLLVTPLAAVGLAVDGTGSISIPTVVPNDPGVVGGMAAFQFILADPSFLQGAALSNGLELAVCDG